MQNPGFEEGFQGWNQPRAAVANAFRLDICRYIMHSGRCSAQLTLDYDARTGSWHSKEVHVPAIVQQAYRTSDGYIGWVLVNHTARRVTCKPQRPWPPWFLELQSSAHVRRVPADGSRLIKSSELTAVDVEPFQVVRMESSQQSSPSHDSSR